MKIWKSAGATEELWFSPTDIEVKIAVIRIDEDGNYWGNCNLIGDIYIGTSTLKDAKKYIEDVILQYYSEQIKYYENLKCSFKEDFSISYDIPCESDCCELRVKNRLTGDIHRVGSREYDSLSVIEGVVAYTDLSNGDGTMCGESSLYEFVDSDSGVFEDMFWGEEDLCTEE